MNEDKTIQQMMQLDSNLWGHGYKGGVNLSDGIKFSLRGRPYLVDMINCDKRVKNFKKGTQVCITTASFINGIHSCYYRKYDKNIIYMMPSVKQVELLCKVSFDPIFTYNSWLMKKGSTNNSTAKEINGRSIVFVGAQVQKVGGVKDSINLRSIPADVVKRDEIDLMDPVMVELSKQRLNASRFRQEENFGSPTYPGHGIDKLFEESDQRHWRIKCDHCSKTTCLAESFPDSITLIDGVWKRTCVHCGKEIYVDDGQWISEYPERREAGFWVSGLINPMADLEEYMYRYHHSEGEKMSEFQRSILGVAATEAEHQLSEQLVLSRCTNDPIQMYSSGETVMGVDVGKKLHVVIGIKTGRGTYEILNISRHDDFQSVHELAKRMNVKMAVIDSGPYDHKVREFQREEPYSVFLCQYSEAQPGKPVWDKNGMVKVNRNEWCDKVHEAFTLNHICIPAQSGEVNEFAREMTKTAKTVVIHPETGLGKPRWIKLGAGDDHFYHSCLYFILGCERSIIRQKYEGAIVRPSHIVSNYSL